MIELRPEPLDGPAGRALLTALFEEGERIYPAITPDNPGPSATPDELAPPGGMFLVAYVGDEAAGCGGIKRLSDEAAELKRLYVTPNLRNRGIARALITGLGDAARDIGYEVIRLDTGDRQPAALRVFRATGYREIGDYNGNPYASYWFEKLL